MPETTVPPGPCPARFTIGRNSHADCELLAGHAGLHVGHQRGAENLAPMTWGIRDAADPSPVPADLPVATDSTAAALIERSSFGTPEAVALRASVSDEVAARVVARAKELEADAPAPAPAPSDRAGLSEIHKRIERYRHEWLWQEADEEHVARWGTHIGQMLYRLPKDGQTTDMQASIESMLADLSAVADRLAVAEQERDEAREIGDHTSCVESYSALLGLVEVVEQARDERAFAEHQRGFVAGHEQAQDDMRFLEQEAATLRAQVAAVETLAESKRGVLTAIVGVGCLNDVIRLDELAAALGDSAPVVQRIKDEGAAEALGDLRQRALRASQTLTASIDAHWEADERQRLRGKVEGVNLVLSYLDEAERARRVRDGEPTFGALSDGEPGYEIDTCDIERDGGDHG